MQSSKNAGPTSRPSASLDDLRLFVALAAGKSFAAAAARTGTTPSTLSRRIAELEDAMGKRLVQRTTRHFALTSDGERLLARTRDPLLSLAQAIDEPEDDQPSGRLRVTAMLATGAELIAPLLMEFAKKYPLVSVELNLTNAVLPLIEEGIDIAFRSAPITDGDLIARRVASWPFALAAAPSMAKAKMKLDELNDVPAVLTRPNSSWKLVAKNGKTREIRPTARFVANDPRVALAAAAAGLGVVAAPRDRISDYGKRLVTISVPGHELAPRELYAVSPSRKLVPARVRLALAFVTEKLRGSKTKAAYPP